MALSYQRVAGFSYTDTFIRYQHLYRLVHRKLRVEKTHTYGRLAAAFIGY